MTSWPLHEIPLQIAAEFLVPLPMYILVCIIFGEMILKDRQTNITCLKQHGWHSFAGVSAWFWYGMFMRVNTAPKSSFTEKVSLLIVHFLLSDFLYYWLHRFCHCKYIYCIHAPHHTHKSTAGARIRMNALSGTCTHVLDMMITGHLPVFLPCFITNLPPSWMLAYVIFINFWVTAGHSCGTRIDYFPSMYCLFVTPIIHAKHHIKGKNNHNFGILLTVWDQIMRTGN